MSQSFKPLTESRAKTFLKKLDENNIHHGFSVKSRFLIQDLKFAQGLSRVDAEDYTETPFTKKSFFYDSTKGNVFPFSYTNTPLQDNFSTIDLEINENTVLSYLLIYTSLLIQNGNRIKAILNYDEIPWQEDVSPMIRKSLDSDFQTYPKISKTHGGFLVTAICIFQQSLMITSFLVNTNGDVKIQDGSVLIEDLPITSLT
jgi:hypothetical protein